MTVKCITGNDASSVMMLVAFASDQKPAKGGAADALLRDFNANNFSKLVNVPVRSDAIWIRSSGVGVVKQKLQVKDLPAGQVISLQLAPDRTRGLVVVGIRVLNEKRQGARP